MLSAARCERMHKLIHWAHWARLSLHCTAIGYVRTSTPFLSLFLQKGFLRPPRHTFIFVLRPINVHHPKTIFMDVDTKAVRYELMTAAHDQR